MSKWNHYICAGCWGRKNPDRAPIRLIPERRSTQKCCYCNVEHTSGIYLRGDPADTPCKGEGEVHNDH